MTWLAWLAVALFAAYLAAYYGGGFLCAWRRERGPYRPDRLACQYRKACGRRRSRDLPPR